MVRAPKALLTFALDSIIEQNKNPNKNVNTCGLGDSITPSPLFTWHL